MTMCSLETPNGTNVESFLLVDEKEQIINAIGGDVYNRAKKSTLYTVHCKIKINGEL